MSDRKPNQHLQDALLWVLRNNNLSSWEDKVASSSPGRYSVSTWCQYLDALQEQRDNYRESLRNKNAKATTTASHDDEDVFYHRALDFVGRRAVAALPRSLKLWKRHLEFHLQEWERSHVTSSGVLPNDQKHTSTSNTCSSTYLVHQMFERALWTLHSFPRIWVLYLEWIVKVLAFYCQTKTNVDDDIELAVRNHLCSATFVRRLINRALQSLPVTQHEKLLWKPLLLPKFLLPPPVTKTITDENQGEQSIVHAPVTMWSVSLVLPLSSKICLLRRYIQLNPHFQRDFADQVLVSGEKWGDAARCYQDLLNKSSSLLTSQSATDASGQVATIWDAFVSVCSEHPQQVEAAGVPWERIVRTLLDENELKQKAREQNVEAASSSFMEGTLWSQLADSWIRRGKFDIARSVYEEGLQRVSKVRDFTILYNAYLQLEESLLEAATARMENEDMDEDEQETEETTDPDDWDILQFSLGQDVDLNQKQQSQSVLAEMEWALARAEHLTKRRPLLLNQVLLRQNPNNIGEWLHRASLYQKQDKRVSQPGRDDLQASSGPLQQAAQVLEEALRTVNATHAINGNPSELVARLVSIYEGFNVDKARDLLDRICKESVYRFRNSDDLAECWVSWIELELRKEQWDEALSLARQSVASGSGGSKKLTKSLRLWDLLLDLEESLGTVQTTKDAYNRAIEIKAATAQHILNFANFLTEHKYFEEAFTAYERGVELFPFPHAGAKLIWKAYAKGFLERYKGTKVERTRDMFERCLEKCPPELCSEFYLMNGQFEEEFGLTKRALSVYRSMCDKVPKEEKLTAYKLFIAKTKKYLGVTATRDIYQEALEKLDDSSISALCLDFSKMETNLQQYDRARAILAYGAQTADPRRLPEYWKAWNEFEIAHGNEETFREMLRIKRSVEAAFSTVNYNATAMNDKVETLTNEEAMTMIASQEGVDVDQQRRQTTVAGFVPSSASGSKRPASAANLDEVEERVAKLRKATGAAEEQAQVADHDGGDEDEIDIDIDDIDAEIEEAAAGGEEPSRPAETDDKNEDIGITTKPVPDAVFGSLTASTSEGQTEA